MKVVLDLSRLRREGKISQEEFERLSRLAARDTGSLAINILIGLGVVAVSGGFLALVRNELAVAAIGAAVLAGGLAFTYAGAKRWDVLATICLLVGALLLAGDIVWFGEGKLAALLLATLVLGGAGIAGRSNLLVALAVLGLAVCLGASTGYWHASYALTITEPTVTIVSFSALALAAYVASHRLGGDYEPLALTASRVSLLLVNFGFWIGSLWGDYPGETWAQGEDYRLWSDREAWRTAHLHVPEIAFIVGWAIVIIAVGAWAARTNRRWVVTTAAVFGAIEFYTQWFERLGAEPWAIIIGGLTVVAFAIALWRYNLTGGGPATVAA